MWRPTTQNDTLMHYSKGQRAKIHKYLEIRGGRYIYPTTASGTSNVGRNAKAQLYKKRGQNWSDNIYTNTHGGSSGKSLPPTTRSKQVQERTKKLDTISRAGKEQTKRAQLKADTAKRQHDARNRDFTAAAKKNARVNRSAGNAKSATNAQMIRKDRKKENLVQTGLRKLMLNLKLLANKVPGVVSTRKAHKKFKK